MGFTVEGNAPRAAAANKITRAGKSPDNDPEIRHARWRSEAAGYVEREALIASLLGKSEEITQEQIRALTAVLEDLPYRLTREEAVFNRAPLALDIADRRADNDREMAVTETEIRAYLAERWSRSQPKEAALDYMADGVWENRQENGRKDRSRSNYETKGDADDIRAAANDNALARIARDVRRAAFGWRHAQAVSTFAAGHTQVLAAYDDLRERTRIEGDTVALGRAYQETLTRHSALLKQAAAFRARPDDFASLLAERGGIGRKDLDAFEELLARARRHRRAATMRYVHRIKREAEQQGIEPGRFQGVLPLEGGAIEAAERAETEERNTVAAPTEVHADVAVPVRNVEPAKPYWYAPYMALRQDWNAFIEGARQAGIMTFYAKGYADMIPRIRALAENPDVPAVTRAPMMQVLENHQRYLSTRKHIEDYLDQADRHIEEHDSMESLAEELDMKVAEISDYPDWRRENDRLTAAGEAILSDMETHGPHLDHILIGETRMNWALLNMSRAIRRDDEAISEEAIAAKKVLAQPETPEEREQMAELEALKFRRLQSAVDDAATQEEREAAQKEFDDYVDRHSDSPAEEEHEGRSISRSWSIRL